MSYLLSLLDKSPIDAGKDAADALKATARAAVRAEELGYHRFWVAEHHDMANLASSAPEALIAYLLAKTSRIRIGSGGVMLQHYSAYKVSEVFNLLASLGPGRVDLGVGKAPGGFPFSTRALQSGIDPANKRNFADQLSEINGYLDATADADGPKATPVPPAAPQRFLLGASVESARLAALAGWQLVFAGHLNGDPENLRETLDVYRKASGGRTAILALAAFAAESEAFAKERVGALRIVKVFLPNGQTVNVGTKEHAAEFARQAGVTDYRTEERVPNLLHGTADQIHRALDELQRQYGIEEFILDTPALTAAERLSSIELLAKERLSLVA